MEEERKWEDLNKDCLGNVVGKVDMQTWLLSLPFVCKSWHDASHDPADWKCLDFSHSSCLWDKPFINAFIDLYAIRNFSPDVFMKFLVTRSSGHATELVLRSGCEAETLEYIADRSTALKILHLPRRLVFHHTQLIKRLIATKWNNLESLVLSSSLNMERILDAIRLHCKNFSSLYITVPYISEEKANYIATLLPNIKNLYLRRATMNRRSLVIILQGCKELVHLDVSDSKGFGVDEEILQFASHIITFKYEGSRLEGERFFNKTYY